MIISTEHNGTHHDFREYEGNDLEEYLNSFKYDEGISLSLAVRRAIIAKKTYIVEPVNDCEDLTIDFRY